MVDTNTYCRVSLIVEVEVVKLTKLQPMTRKSNVYIATELGT